MFDKQAGGHRRSRKKLFAPSLNRLHAGSFCRGPPGRRPKHQPASRTWIVMTTRRPLKATQVPRSPKSDLTAAAVQQSVFSPNYVEARHGILDHAVGMSLPT